MASLPAEAVLLQADLYIDIYIYLQADIYVENHIGPLRDMEKLVNVVCEAPDLHTAEEGKAGLQLKQFSLCQGKM